MIFASKLAEFARKALGVGLVNHRILHHLQLINLPLDFTGCVGYVLFARSLNAQVLLLAADWRLLSCFDEDTPAMNLTARHFLNLANKVLGLHLHANNWLQVIYFDLEGVDAEALVFRFVELVEYFKCII